MLHDSGDTGGGGMVDARLPPKSPVAPGRPTSGELPLTGTQQLTGAEPLVIEDRADT